MTRHLYLHFAFAALFIGAGLVACGGDEFVPTTASGEESAVGNTGDTINPPDTATCELTLVNRMVTALDFRIVNDDGLEAYSDAIPAYEMTTFSIPIDTYAIEVSAEGYVTLSQPLNLHEGGTVLQLELEPSPPVPEIVRACRELDRQIGGTWRKNDAPPNYLMEVVVVVAGNTCDVTLQGLGALAEGTTHGVTSLPFEETWPEGEYYRLWFEESTGTLFNEVYDPAFGPQPGRASYRRPD